MVSVVGVLLYSSSTRSSRRRQTRLTIQLATLARHTRGLLHPALRRGPQCGEHVLDGHAHSIVRVDEACVDNAIGADDEGRRNW
jgi:hypothetical protein